MGEERLHLCWVDVGKLAAWGHPESFEKRHNFPEYANWMWDQGAKPDLILIDGRFRIFCFLTSLLRACPRTLILFDDYSDRSVYHVVEEFLPVTDRCGRQALFEVTSSARALVDQELLLSFQNVTT